MDRLAYLLYRFASALLSFLPLPGICRFGGFAGICAYYLLPQYRRLALRNLEIAFGAEKTAGERRRMARKHFKTLGGNLLASIRVARMSAEEVRSVGEMEGEEIPRRLIEKGQGIVFVLAHLGNWEFMSQLTPLLVPGPLGTIYQRLGNRFIDADFRASRARLGLQLFERKEGFQGALKMIRAGGGVGVLADQHAGDAGVWCPFFGRLASTSSLAAMLALRAGAVVLPVTITTLRPGRWRMTFEKALSFDTRDVEELTAIINLNLEERIRRAPEDWFWVHNRWKTPKPKFLLTTYKRGVVPSQDDRPLQPFRILIRSTNWLGDAVMSVPAVRAIKAGRPDAHVTELVPAKLAQVWQAVPEVDEVIPIRAGEGVFSIARKLRGKFDVAIVFPNSVRSALEVWLAGVPRRVGYPGHRRAWLLNQILRDKKKKIAAPRHQVEHYLRLGEFVGAENLGLLPAAEGRPAARLDARIRIAICAGAEYGSAKRWPAERFAEAIKLVAERRMIEWVLVGVEKDAPIAAEIKAHVGVPIGDRVGQTTIEELIAELRGCVLLLTNDTGTMHLAALLDVPVVAVFGSTEPSLTGPLGAGHRILRHHVECSPCFLRDCPLDFRCMTAVQPDEAVQAIEEILSRRTASPAPVG